MKFLISLIFIVVISQTDCFFGGNKGSNFRQPFPSKPCQEKCPSVNPAANFEINLSQGRWYNLIAHSNIVPPGETCTVYIYSASTTVTNQYDTEIRTILSPATNPLTFNLPPSIYNTSRPGVFLQNRTIQSLNTLGQQVQVTFPTETTILYLDSDYQLRYGCGLYQNGTSTKKYEFYSLTKSNRASDSLASTWLILSLLKSVPTDLNKGIFIPNGPTCTL